MAAMAGAMLTLTINFAAVKYVADELPLGEVFSLRAAAALVLIAVAILATGSHRQIGLILHRTVLVRTAFESTSALIFFLGVVRMPLASATVILQSLPLVVTAGAAIILREKVPPDRWLAIAAGFAGVLIVIQPGVGETSLAALFVVAAVLLTAGRDLVTRQMPVAIPSLLVAAATLFCQVFIGLGLGVTEDWRWPTPFEAGVIGATASLFVVGLFLLVVAIRLAPVSLVSPLRYSSIVWAIGIDYLVWGSLLGGAAALGSAIIILSGVYVTLSARRGPAIGAESTGMRK